MAKTLNLPPVLHRNEYPQLVETMKDYLVSSEGIISFNTEDIEVFFSIGQTFYYSFGTSADAKEAGENAISKGQLDGLELTGLLMRIICGNTITLSQVETVATKVYEELFKQSECPIIFSAEINTDDPTSEEIIVELVGRGC